jgi:DNA-binding LytR/AlgR family response regulator
MKWNCLIVDDEPPALEVLRTYIKSIPMLQLAGECNHALSAFQLLQQQRIDLLFLDVNMPKLKGTDFIRSLEKPPKVIFTTAHAERYTAQRLLTIRPTKKYRRRLTDFYTSVPIGK